MKRSFLHILLVMSVLLSPITCFASSDGEKKSSVEDPKELIFEHLGDAYGWEVPFNHHKRIPLPVILIGKDGVHCFMSSKVEHGHVYDDGGALFKIAGADSPYKGKIVQIRPDNTEYRPIDISITKNVMALFIGIALMLWSVFAVAGWYKKKGYKAPRRVLGMLEALIEFVYIDVIKAILGKNSRRFAPYLLTVFFLIFYLNLLGLLVVFPGGANVTGNIGVTLVLALFTFVATNLFAKKHYWKEIFWPDVPLLLKFPIPIMQVIEFFGVFTKPAALTIRLFANMMGGHMIVLVLTIIIFIFADMGIALVTGFSTVVALLFSVFVILLDVLVSFIQAYVFTMLSTIFIGIAQEDGHEEHSEAEDDKVSPQVSEVN